MLEELLPGGGKSVRFSPVRPAGAAGEWRRSPSREETVPEIDLNEE